MVKKLYSVTHSKVFIVNPCSNLNKFTCENVLLWKTPLLYIVCAFPLEQIFSYDVVLATYTEEDALTIS